MSTLTAYHSKHFFSLVSVGLVGPVRQGRQSGDDGLRHRVVEPWCPAGQFPTAGGGVVGSGGRFKVFQAADFGHMDVCDGGPFCSF